jgi:hypothetical protein
MDASKHCVAGYLAKVNDKGREKPVAFASEKLSDSQPSCAVISEEVYAVICSLRKFRNWILGV